MDRRRPIAVLWLVRAIVVGIIVPLVLVGAATIVEAHHAPVVVSSSYLYDTPITAGADARGASPSEGATAHTLSGEERAQGPAVAPRRKATTLAGSLVTPSTSPLVPGGGLAAHERAGGHALARHLGKSDADLLARVQAQPNITGSSSWSNRAIAEASIADVLSANSSGVQSWLAGSGNKLVLNGGGSSTVGRYVAQGSSSVQNVSGVRVVLVRDPSLGMGYRIQTAFPTP